MRFLTIGILSLFGLAIVPATSAANSDWVSHGTFPVYPRSECPDTYRSLPGGPNLGCTSSDSFADVYGWYRAAMPAGSEIAHTRSPVAHATFAIRTGRKLTVLIQVWSDRTMIWFYDGVKGIVVYPGAWVVTPFSTAEGTYSKTSDPFSNVYAWYQHSLPAGSEMPHAAGTADGELFTFRVYKSRTKLSIRRLGKDTVIAVN